MEKNTKRLLLSSQNQTKDDFERPRVKKKENGKEKWTLEDGKSEGLLRMKNS